MDCHHANLVDSRLHHHRVNLLRLHLDSQVVIRHHSRVPYRASNHHCHLVSLQVNQVRSLHRNQVQIQRLILLPNRLLCHLHSQVQCHQGSLPASRRVSHQANQVEFQQFFRQLPHLRGLLSLRDNLQLNHLSNHPVSLLGYRLDNLLVVQVANLRRNHQAYLLVNPLGSLQVILQDSRQDNLLRCHLVNLLRTQVLNQLLNLTQLHRHSLLLFHQVSRLVNLQVVRVHSLLGCPQ